MIRLTSHTFLCVALKIRRLFRHALPAKTTDEKLRNLHLGRPPRVDHPLSFLWSLDETHLNSWILHGETILFLWNMLLKSEPTNVLEMGTGWSSLMFARYAKELYQTTGQWVNITSIEHDSNWASKSEKLLRNYNLDKFINIVICPLQNVEVDGVVGKSYGLETLLGQDFDFVLIDGPPTFVGRELTLPSVMPLTTVEGLIFVDDAQRSIEHAAISQWILKYNSLISFKGFVPVGNGLAYFQKI